MLLGLEEMTWEVEAQRRAPAERLESEHRSALELELARQAQARLFPQTQPALKTVEVAAVCVQARHVGGDYYDFLDLGRERFGLVIADISGKGTAAALLMANLQAHLHNQCATYWSRPFIPLALEQPDRFLRSANRLFYENTTDETYATLFFAEYHDPMQGLRYANCGHLAAPIVRRDDGLDRLESTGPALGLFREWNGSSGECRLDPGDTLALYTDGVTESFNDAGEEFGEQRLIEALRRHRQQSSQDLLASVVEEVQQFSPHEQHDEITLIVAKRSAD
jgi:serine phosphatase RsbU (regulator of sigma subunit)